MYPAAAAAAAVKAHTSTLSSEGGGGEKESGVFLRHRDAIGAGSWPLKLC